MMQSGCHFKEAIYLRQLLNQVVDHGDGRQSRWEEDPLSENDVEDGHPLLEHELEAFVEVQHDEFPKEVHDQG